MANDATLLGALILIMLGLLLQWPRLLTLAMFPVLVVMYARLARREETEMRGTFGAEYLRYSAEVPGVVPHRGSARHRSRNTGD